MERIAHEWVKGLNQEQALRVFFEKVMDIPYGFIVSRDPLRVSKAKKGQLGGKNFLLAALYRAIIFDVKDMLCSFCRFSNIRTDEGIS